MVNYLLYSEEKLLEKIKKEHLKISFFCWELLDGRLRNDLSIISLALSSIYLYPRWILKLINLILKVYWRLCIFKGKPLDLLSIIERSLIQIKKIDDFLRTLRQETIKE